MSCLDGAQIVASKRTSLSVKYSYSVLRVHSIWTDKDLELFSMSNPCLSKLAQLQSFLSPMNTICFGEASADTRSCLYYELAMGHCRFEGDLTMPPTLNTSGNVGNSVISLHLQYELFWLLGQMAREEGKGLHVLFLGLFLTWKTIKWIFKIESQVSDFLFLYVAFSSRCNLIKNEVLFQI